MKPSRAMITGELSWAWVALSFAWSGSGLWPFESSYLHVTLDRRGQEWIWSLFVGVPAVALMIASAREWFSHCYFALAPTMRSWSIFQLDKSASVRGWLCLALAFSWLYVLYVMLTSTGRPNAILPVALGGLVFMIMFWLENRRVQRDIRKHTASFLAPT